MTPLAASETHTSDTTNNTAEKPVLSTKQNILVRKRKHDDQHVELFKLLKKREEQ